jgi:hypothetical protein
MQTDSDKRTVIFGLSSSEAFGLMIGTMVYLAIIFAICAWPPLQSQQNLMAGHGARVVSIGGIVVCGFVMTWVEEPPFWYRRGLPLVLVCLPVIAGINTFAGLFTIHG